MLNQPVVDRCEQAFVPLHAAIAELIADTRASTAASVATLKAAAAPELPRVDQPFREVIASFRSLMEDVCRYN